MTGTHCEEITLAVLGLCGAGLTFAYFTYRHLTRDNEVETYSPVGATTQPVLALQPTPHLPPRP